MRKMQKITKGILKVLIVGLIIIGVSGINVYYTINYTYNHLFGGKLRAFKYDIDNSIPFLTSVDNTSILLDNPDRGYRMECYLTLGTNFSYPAKNITQADEEVVPTSSGGYESIQSQMERYALDRPKIVQQYIYLTLYRERKEIPATALNQLKMYFEYIRSLNIKMLLRFAYRNEQNEVDPAADIMFVHIAQLKEWFQNNSQLVADTVYCLQLGFLGYWGEGWGYKVTYDVPAVISSVCEMVPSWMYVNVRTLGYYNQTPVQYRSRVGIHDDFLIGYHDEWSTVMPDDEFQKPYYRDLFQRTINDGEMVWGAYQGKYGDYIDGMVVTQYVYDYSLSTLSIVHNYIESGLAAPYNMDRWKSEYLNARIFAQYGWNYNPHLLNAQGNISIFEYLKYHLGYQLVLSNLTTANNQLRFMISNYGMAAPFNMDTLRVQITYKNGTIVNITPTYTPHGLYAFGQLVYSLVIDSANLDTVCVKLYNSRNSDFVRFANNIVSLNGYYRIFT